MVCGVQFNADAERRGDDLADLGDDVQDELGSFFGGAAIGVCAMVCLRLLGTVFSDRRERGLLPLDSEIDLMSLAASRNTR